MANKSLVSCFVLALAAILSAGCSHSKSIGRDEALSRLRSTESLAAEAEMFIDFVLQGRATNPYAQGHAAYLQKEAQRSANELENRTAESDAARWVRDCRTQLHAMIREFPGIRAAIRDPTRLAAAKARIRQVRESLEQADSHL